MESEEMIKDSKNKEILKILSNSPLQTEGAGMLLGGLLENGDFVVIPKGYHPFTVAPGYKNYCLWIMAGKERGLLSASEECHKWIVAK